MWRVLEKGPPAEETARMNSNLFYYFYRGCGDGCGELSRSESGVDLTVQVQRHCHDQHEDKTQVMGVVGRCLGGSGRSLVMSKCGLAFGVVSVALGGVRACLRSLGMLEWRWAEFWWCWEEIW